MRVRLPVLVASAALVVAACGTTEAAPDTGESAAPGAGPVTVTDSRGKEVTLDAPADEVVALEWSEAEDLVTLGVMPVGVADVDGYRTWVGAAAPLDEGVADVGIRTEPSVESIVELDPDVVVMEVRDTRLVRQLERYVPVITLTGSNPDDNIAQMKANLEIIATATGTEDAAEEVLAGFDRKLAEGRQALRRAGVAGERFAMADGWKQGSTVNIRMFGEGSLTSQIFEELGLQNGYTGEVNDKEWGLGQTDVEGLTQLGDVHFFYSASGEDVFAGGLAGNAIWESLPFVERGKVHKLKDGTWTFGGPASGEFIIDQVVTTLTR